MTLSTQAYKGSRDFYPEDKKIQQWMFSKVRKILNSYAFEEYDGPLLEPFDLYAAKSGQEIVEKQLYWFMDRGERKVAIRPEMTPTLARMVAARMQELPKPVRWFSIPNLWRYERPQKGRLREHWQINVDVLGGEAHLADLEILSLAQDIFEGFGGLNHLSLRVNNRKLTDNVFTKVLSLSPAQAVALMKAIDAKDKMPEAEFQALITNIGLTVESHKKLQNYLEADVESLGKNFPCEGTEELKSLFSLLRAAGRDKSVVFDPAIMRGLDYYTGTVFEAFDVSPENRRALFGGGRYDNLVGLFTKQKLSGMGFGLGDVTLLDFLQTHRLIPSLKKGVDVYFASIGAPLSDVDRLTRVLRAEGFSVLNNLETGGLGAQLKAASKHHARFALILGEDEIKNKTISVKNMETGEQSTCSQSNLIQHLK